MRVIAHVSDLHFGTEDHAVAIALLLELNGTALPLPSPLRKGFPIEAQQ